MGEDVRRALAALREALAALADPDVAASSARYFQAGPGGYGEGERIHRTYLEHARFVNGWDLVDTSAEHLVGPHVDPADPTLLDRLAASDSVWERRIAMMATFHWTRKGVVEPALRIADRLQGDPHDLIQKAVGWMVREVGKRDPQRFDAFLAERYRRMPRTMLRYAIERLPEERRQRYLRGEV